MLRKTGASIVDCPSKAAEGVNILVNLSPAPTVIATDDPFLCTLAFESMAVRRGAAGLMSGVYTFSNAPAGLCPQVICVFTHAQAEAVLFGDPDSEHNKARSCPNTTAIITSQLAAVCWTNLLFLRP